MGWINNNLKLYNHNNIDFEPIENGVARFKVENLTAGIKTVYASYVGDNNYTGNHTSANFTVKKHNLVITVNAADINVGDVVLINVTAPVDVTGPVIVNVGGVDNFAPISYNVYDNVCCSHQVEVQYEGLWPSIQDWKERECPRYV